MCHDRVDKMAFNKENLDAYDIALTNSKLSDQKVMQFFLLHRQKKKKRENFILFRGDFFFFFFVFS
jgi:hypothetical protein